MKSTKHLIAIALFTICIIATSNARITKIINVDGNSYNMLLPTLSNDDANILFNVTKDGSEVNLSVSYNGNEGATGTLLIYNASNKLVSEFRITLKHSPNADNVNLSEYASGTYTCQLKTATGGVHISHFTIN